MIPREIYTLGAVQFNTQPLAQLQGQLLAKKAAKEEALNKYFNDLQGKINTAGVRTQDLQGPLGGINQDIENWRKNWITNKDAISQGGIAQQEHLAKFQDIIRKIDQSKNRTKTADEIAKLKLSGKFEPDDDDIKTIQNIDYSIYDPRSYKQDGVTEYGLQDLSPALPQFDAAKQIQHFNAVQGKRLPGEVPDTSRAPIINKKTGYVDVPYKKEFTNQQILEMSNDAAELVKTNKVAKRYYSEIANDPKSETFIRFKKAFDPYHPGEIMDTPEELAKADAIIRFSGPIESSYKSQREENWKEKALFAAYLRKEKEKDRIDSSIKGNSLDEIGTVKTILSNNIAIVDGIARDVKGNRWSGNVNIEYKDLPANLVTVMEFNKTPIDPDSPISLNIKEGKIIGFSQSGLPITNRQAVENAQIKYNTEAISNIQPTFGTIETIDINDLPVGAKVTEKNGTFYYKGKKVIQ